MAFFRPKLYATLVLAVWSRAQIVNHQGQPWGDTPDLKPELLAVEPPTSIQGASVADWMVATAMIAEIKDQSFFRDLLGHDDYLGQDAHGPGGKTVDHARGLTYAWDVSKFMRELLGCHETDRQMAYWVPRPSVTDRMVELTQSGALARGETVLLCLISNSMWKRAEYDADVANADGWSVPEHWVRVRSVEPQGGELLCIKVFSFGEVEERHISRTGWQRLYFEAIFGSLTPE